MTGAGLGPEHSRANREPCEVHKMAPCPFCAAERYREWNRAQIDLEREQQAEGRLLRAFCWTVAIEVLAVAAVLWWAFAWHTH